MEQLQFSYLNAIAAASGCMVYEPRFDDGIDVMLSHNTESHQGGEALLQVQLKATATSANDKDSHVAARMSRNRYDLYRLRNPTIEKIVIIMSLPAIQSHWTYSRHRSLSVFRCSYWVNLAGAAESTAAQPSVRAPKSQIFNDFALCDMMERIGKGGKP